jgi:nicotinamide mononucleotide transporter
MLEYLSVDKIAFTIIGYPMSWIELFGTAFNLWSVYLIAKRKMLTWPTGIIGVILFMILFYQIQLYSDALEQIYYLGVSIYGWWAWNRVKRDNKIPVIFSNQRKIVRDVLQTIIISGALGLFMTHIHIYWPKLFPEPASYPYWDALTTVMSFTAMWLMTMRRTESWVYWIIVDVIGVCLYYVKDVKLLSLLYLIFLCLASNGFRLWLKERKP